MNVLSFMTRSSATLVEIIRIYYENSDLSRVECDIWIWKNKRLATTEDYNELFKPIVFFCPRRKKSLSSDESARRVLVYVYIVVS